MGKSKKTDGDAAVPAAIDEAPGITLGSESPAEPFEERTGEVQYTTDGPSEDERIAQAEASRGRLQEVGLIPKGEPTSTRSLAVPADLPWWYVEALCGTPVNPRSLVVQADTRQEAEAQYRFKSGLAGSISGGLFIREAEPHEIPQPE